MKKIISVLIAVFLFCCVTVVAMASPGTIQEPGFETINSWTYSETYQGFAGGQSTDWVKEGAYSYKFSSTKAPALNNYCQIGQAVNFTYLDTVCFDARLWAEEANRFKASVLVGTSEVWWKDCSPTATDYLHQEVDVSGYTGSYDLIFRITCINAATPFSLNDQINYFDNIKTWGSFSDLAHTTVCNSFSDYGSTVYMFGEGFVPAQTYRVVFWDQVDTTWYNRETQDRDAAAAGLNAQHVLVGGVDTAGTWQAVVYNSTSYEPTTYDPNDVYLVVADSFQVQTSAIPEFPTAVSGIAVAGTCGGVYLWLRKRRLKDVEI